MAAAVGGLLLPFFMPLSQAQLQSRAARYWSNLGTARETDGKKDIITWARYVAGKFPGEYSAHVWLGRAYRARGRNDEAIESYRKVLSLRPQEVEAGSQFGDIFSARKGIRQAGEVLPHPPRASPPICQCCGVFSGRKMGRKRADNSRQSSSKIPTLRRPAGSCSSWRTDGNRC